MSTIEHIERPLQHSSVTKLSIAGAICYALWGCLHLMAANAVYHLGATLEPGMVQGRIFQDAWNLLFFGVTAIAVALTLNIRNNVWGYWINVGVLALADTGLIFFHTDSRAHAALARFGRSGPVDPRLDPDNDRLFPQGPRYSLGSRVQNKSALTGQPMVTFQVQARRRR
jgi:hypothetical protein